VLHQCGNQKLRRLGTGHPDRFPEQERLAFWEQRTPASAARLTNYCLLRSAQFLRSFLAILRIALCSHQ
jgi:hypothetical protein